MVKLGELYLLGNKVVVVCDIVYSSTEKGNLIFYKEENNYRDLLQCQLEKSFLSLATPFVHDVMPHDD